MTAPEQRRYGCAVCRRPLNRFAGADGVLSYRHAVRAEPTDHDPVPRLADRIPGGVIEACDFCAVDDTNLWLYRTAEITLVAESPFAEVVNSYGTGWNACPACAELIAADDRDGLHHRVLAAAGLARSGVAATAVRDFVDTVLGALRPGRVLLPGGRQGAPPPLPDRLLPKIRDRLTALLGPGNIVPGLPDATAREEIAAGLPVSRLYAIDPDYTDMARSAAGSLPSISVTALDVPAPFGLLTWAHPVDRDATTAMSWASDDTGVVHIAGYRPLATPISGAQLQKLREQAGWLIATHATALHPGERIDATHPAAVLVATWLLIAHRLSEQIPVPVDAPIRRAYARAGRPAPEVHIVRLRPSHRPAVSAGADAATALGSAARRLRREPEYRWWVGAFVREQAHGPSHSLRRPVLVMPFVNGPRGRPVAASTVVRLLSTPAPRPDTPTPSTPAHDHAAAPSGSAPPAAVGEEDSAAPSDASW